VLASQQAIVWIALVGASALNKLAGTVYTAGMEATSGIQEIAVILVEGLADIALKNRKNSHRGKREKQNQQHLF